MFSMLRGLLLAFLSLWGCAVPGSGHFAPLAQVCCNVLVVGWVPGGSGVVSGDDIVGWRASQTISLQGFVVPVV